MSRMTSGQDGYQFIGPANTACSGSFSSGISRGLSNRSTEARDTLPGHEFAADTISNEAAVSMLPGLSSFRAFPDSRKSVQSIIAHLQKCQNEALVPGQASWSPALDTIHSSSGTPISPLSPLSGSSSKVHNSPGKRLSSMSSMFKAKPRSQWQGEFAEPRETAMIFDWDDTLFPTSFLIHRCKLNGLARLQDQSLYPDMKAALTQSLSTLAAEVVALLRLAGTCGRVILVTLARPHWVKVSCMYFMPRVWEVIREQNIKVVYAQEGIQPKEPECLEEFRYARMKARAITKELEHFYSQYEGQSWKNVISIGDSQNERLGTMEATEVYLRRKQAEAASSGPRRSGLMAALSSVSGAALAEVSATLQIQKVYRGYAARRQFNLLLLPTLIKAKEQAKGRLRAAFLSSSSSSVAKVPEPPEEIAIPKCYAAHASSSVPKSYARHASYARPAFTYGSGQGVPPSFDAPPAARVNDTLRVRTKTVKMVDDPWMLELWAQLQLLKTWLPRIVKQDRSLDIDLNSLHSPDVLQRIEDLLSSR